MALSFRPLTLLALVMIAACSTAPEQRVAVPPASVETKQRIAFGSVLLREVSLPSYAASEEIFVADTTGLLSARRGLFWADDPARAITLELARHLGRVTGARVVSEPWPFDTPAEAQVEVRVEEMLARQAGSFRLAGQYFVTSESGRARLFEIEVPLPPSEDAETGIDATALAQARGQAVRDLAVEIARNGLR